MPQFYIDSSEIQQGVVSLGKKDAHHAISVLRLKAGDAVQLFDGRGAHFSGVIASLQKGRVSVLVNQNSKVLSVPDTEVSLAVSVIKPERMGLLVQKASEMGVHSLFPLITERSVVRLSKERWISKAERWRKIALEACK